MKDELKGFGLVALTPEERKSVENLLWPLFIQIYILFKGFAFLVKYNILLHDHFENL